MVGASLACALGGTGLEVAVLEAVPLGARSQPSYDERVIALAWGTRLILEGMGVWESVARESAPIEQIHVSDRGRFGFARLDRRSEGVEALGYVAPARVLGAALHRHLGALDNLSLYCPAQVVGFRVAEDRVSLEAQIEGRPRLLQARLLVAADGGDSRIRQRLGFALREWSYGHTAVISTVTPDRAQPGQAFERFTDSGPLAMLPMTGGRYSTVWTVRDETAAHLLTQGDRDFLAGLQECFGYRLGRLQQLGRRVAYPLRLLQVKEPVRRRLVLIGNAAHTLHPVAGQGFNLGIRDAAALGDVLGAVAARGADPGDPLNLRQYADWRRRDQRSVTLITDALARVFSNPLAPVRWARNLGLLGLDLAPGLKHLAARQFMGLRGYQARFSRGPRPS